MVTDMGVGKVAGGTGEGKASISVVGERKQPACDYTAFFEAVRKPAWLRC